MLVCLGPTPRCIYLQLAILKGFSKDFQRVNSTLDVIDVAIHFIKVI